MALLITFVFLNEKNPDVFHFGDENYGWLIDFSNISIFGLTIVRAIDPAVNTAWMWVPPAWSLDIEITFYILAPLLVMGRKRVIISLLLSYFLTEHARIHIFNLPYAEEFYIVFPEMLFFLMLGAASFYWIRPIPSIGWWLFAIILALLIFGQFFSLSPFIAPRAETLEDTVELARKSVSSNYALLIYASFAISLPHMFAATKNMRWDAYLGDMAYPIFILHWAIQNHALPTITQNIEFNYPSEMIGILVIVVSLVAFHLVTSPLERVRTHIREAPKELKVYVS